MFLFLLPPVFCLTLGFATLVVINALWAIPNNWEGGAVGIACGALWLIVGAAVAFWADGEL